jgi:hypothetical protein
MYTKNKNRGFAILEILLLIVTLSFVAAIAYVVLRHAKQKPAQPIVFTSNADGIKITEWNVFLTNPDDSQKISYHIAGKDQPDDIIVSSTALDKLSSDHPECSNANKFIQIKRAAAAPAQPENKQVGNYFYYNLPKPAQSPCIGTDISLMQALSNQAYDLYDKLPTYKNIVQKL